MYDEDKSIRVSQDLAGANKRLHASSTDRQAAHAHDDSPFAAVTFVREGPARRKNKNPSLESAWVLLLRVSHALVFACLAPQLDQRRSDALHGLRVPFHR